MRADLKKTIQANTRDVLLLCQIVAANEVSQTAVYPEYGMQAAAARLVQKRLISESPGIRKKYIPTPQGERVARLCVAILKEY